ncbi:MAG: hypothetical protein K9H48_18695 [Melioribacteraceae bacterium]|nr:hypothetical protein [Melioribacteraceae bacterium]MCF8396057.1 hypothetical protein [Melioribacteraceae bacterium]MCF8418955.1 hypothetical protein [Melioribacteraceae bacterium]
MKGLILITLLFISTNYFAQDKNVIKTELATDQANHWMTNIASNPHMRLQMMQMMIEQTADKPDEMQLLINQILNNAEMKKMIRKTSFQNNGDTKNSMNMMKRYNHIMKETAPKKKPEIKK